jgi:uncharacterized membrane protein YhhN
MSQTVPSSGWPTPDRTDGPTAARPASTLAAVLLVTFGVVAAARLVAIPLDLPFDLARWSTFALMSSLAAWVAVQRGPLLLVVALLFSCAGDILLGSGDDLFIAGMGAFAVAHICYVTTFVRSGALARLRGRWHLVPAYAVALAGLIVWLWPALPGDLRIPLTAYALLLTATAVTSAASGLWTGLGGGLFFVSDALIAVGIAERPEPPMPSMWVMTTYIAAQVLLATGIVRSAGSTRR